MARHDARDLPEAACVYEEPGYAEGHPPAVVREYAEMAAARDRHSLGRFLSEVDPGLRLARAARLERIRESGYAFSFDTMEEPGAEVWDPPFERPTLFFLGRQDTCTGYRDALRLARSYPRSSYAILDGAGHNGQIEQAGLFSALVGEWIGRCEADKPRK